MAAEEVIDEVVDEVHRPSRRAAAVPRAIVAWGTLGGISAALCLVVAVAGGRAPSSTPFFAAGAAAAAGAGAGALLEASKKSLRLSGPAHAAVVLGVAFITVLPAGLIKYTYGADGTMEISMTASPLTFNFGEGPGVITGEVLLINDGATTVRIRPVVALRVSDGAGASRPQVVEGCPLPDAPRPTEGDLVEVAPGASFSSPFTVRIAWVGANNTPSGCGAFLLSQPGVYALTATFDSHPYDAFALVPVWSTSLTSPSARIEVH